MCKAGLNPAGDAGFIDYTSSFLQVCSGPQIQNTPEVCEWHATAGPTRCPCGDAFLGHMMAHGTCVACIAPSQSLSLPSLVQHDHIDQD